jgi:hypothetical protein
MRRYLPPNLALAVTFADPGRCAVAARGRAADRR